MSDRIKAALQALDQDLDRLEMLVSSPAISKDLPEDQSGADQRAAVEALKSRIDTAAATVAQLQARLGVAPADTSKATAGAGD